MTYLWNISTTIRNCNRLPSFIQTAREIEGSVWNHETQIRYQVLLIRNGFYNPTNYHPCMDNTPLSLEDAQTIFDHQGYVDPSMRGRTSLNPLVKFGFVNIDNNRVISVTPRGLRLLESTDVLTDALIAWSFTHNGANIKPFIALLHFLYRLRTNYSINGITTQEFSLFVMTINQVTDIDQNINQLVYKRNNPHHQVPINNICNLNNLDDYLDNNIRYLGQSPLLSITSQCISLNMDHISLINYLINTYNGRADQPII